MLKGLVLGLVIEREAAQPPRGIHLYLHPVNLPGTQRVAGEKTYGILMSKPQRDQRANLYEVHARARRESSTTGQSCYLRQHPGPITKLPSHSDRIQLNVGFLNL